MQLEQRINDTVQRYYATSQVVPARQVIGPNASARPEGRFFFLRAPCAAPLAAERDS